MQIGRRRDGETWLDLSEPGGVLPGNYVLAANHAHSPATSSTAEWRYIRAFKSLSALAA